MRCFKCGAKIDRDSKFCPVCGNRIEPKTIEKREKKDSNKTQWMVCILVSVLFVTAALFIISALLKRNSVDEGSQIYVNNTRTVGDRMNESRAEEGSANSEQTDFVIFSSSEEGSQSTITKGSTITQSPTNTPRPTNTPTPTPKPKATVAVEPDNTTQTSASSERSSGENPTASDSEYIFADSDSAYLSESQLKNLTKDQLKYARNEIYARHGRKFTDTSIQAYFNGKSWYVPSYEPEQFDKIEESVFNDYEKKNIELIVKVEKAKGYRK